MTESCRNLQNGIATVALAYIDVVTDSVKKNILAGKYVKLARILIPDFETPNVAPEGGCWRIICSFTYICKKCKGVGHGFPFM